MANMCTNPARGLLVFTGICYLVSAGGLAYVGVWVFSTYDHFDEIADAYLTLVPASIILGVSVFMCITAFLAFIVIYKINKLLFSVFSLLILLVFTGELLAGSLGYEYRSKVEDVLDDDLTDAVNNYNVIAYKEQIDYLQKEFKCCGVHNASNWQDSTFWKVNHTDIVPMSCCKPSDTCNPTLGSNDIFKKGCLNELNDEFRKNLSYIAGSAVFLAVVQFLTLISACILVCRSALI